MSLIRRVAAALQPEPGTTEGAVMLGLALLGIGGGLAWLPLAFLIPGALLVAIGLGLNLARRAD
jgi:hypothetical protein